MIFAGPDISRSCGSLPRMGTTVGFLEAAAVRWMVQLSLVAALAAAMGCHRRNVGNWIVVTQAPVTPSGVSLPGNILDSRYPPGSRVVAIDPKAKQPLQRVLSDGMYSAGEPVVSPDGQKVMFVARATGESTWQVFECAFARGKPVVRTAMPNGAMGPSYLPDGRFAFSSPVPKPGGDLSGPDLPELYAQGVGQEQPKRLTFGLAGAFDATVLADGRILFVSGGSRFAPVTNQALFTINNDGT